jgi:serine/threonine protein kinase
MGEVHLCDDRRLRCQVALKKLHAAAAAKLEDRARFTREALAQRQLEHPAIVPVHDVGIDDDGSLYFTMRRIRGTTLDEILSEQAKESAAFAGEYSRHRLLCAFTKVCLAVDYAHDHGILHCDLKPANIMLGPYGEVYVLDWGLARQIGEDADESPCGTPGFMAPEVIRSGMLDARSDVYSLGSMLYELLTLCPLHGGAEPLALMYSTLEGGIVLPSIRAPWRGIAPELDAICLRATALEPEGRYRTARALHDAVERFLEG